ncbi:MAG: preprotein translocase subunit YajC [Pseudomonadota bacterium]
MLPLILIFVIFYFLLIRPQQKRARLHREMLAALAKGDKVVTGGGVIGTIIKADDHELTIQIAEGVKVRVMRGTVASKAPEPPPTVKAKATEKASAPPVTLGQRLVGFFSGSSQK